MLAKYDKAFKLVDQISLTQRKESLPDFVIDKDYRITQPQSHLYTQGGTALFYFPSPTATLLHKDNSFFRVVMGPFGSGKTVMCIKDMLIKTIEYPACLDGVRRTKWLVVRNTYDMLDISTIPSFKFWFQHVGEKEETKKPPRYRGRFNVQILETGEIRKVDLWIIFLSLDDQEDIRKLKSVDCTGIYLNELSEFTPILRGVLKGRIGRYPEKKICPNRKGKWLLADTNAPSEKSWIFDVFGKRKWEAEQGEWKSTPADWVMYIQPPGLVKDDAGNWIENPERENAAYLDPDYYTKMAEGESEEFIKVFCLAEWGSVIGGKVIYPQYNDAIHSIDEIKYNENLPIFTDWDFGNTPACTLKQVYSTGQICVFKEFVTMESNLEEILDNQVIPWLNQNCPNWRIQASYGDPTGINKAPTDGTHCFDILNKRGFNGIAARSNKPIVRWDATKSILSRMSMGKPLFLISRQGCPTLREGFLGGYHYKMMRTKEGLVPTNNADKNFNSHVHDANQYGILEMSNYAININKPEPEIVYYNEPAY